jgi:hypothetical protein
VIDWLAVGAETTAEPPKADALVSSTVRDCARDGLTIPLNPNISEKKMRCDTKLRQSIEWIESIIYEVLDVELKICIVKFGLPAIEIVVKGRNPLNHMHTIVF